MRRIVALMSFGLLIASASAASAQDFPRPQQSSIDGVEFLVGYMDYDLSGTGSTVPVAIRGTKALTRNLSLEFGGTFATPEQQFGSSRFLAPEARLTYSWGTGRFRPFVSGGGGFAMVRSDLADTRWRSSLTAGGGARVHLSDRLYAVGEMRLRGLSNFAASTAEWLGGIGWEVR
jgi:opacity protein-like surface antigen